MPKQLNVNLAFTADTSKASKEIQSLQQQLTQLMNTAVQNSNTLGLTKDIREASTAVAQLKAQLSNAMTTSGTLDLSKFNDSLRTSGMTLEEYRKKLSSLGPEGTQAFSALASQISSAEIPLKRANTLLSEMGTTLMNTARWQLSSSLLHGFIGGLQHAYGYAQDLNQSLNNIRIVTGQSTEQMAQLAQKANQAARELSTRTTDYTNASLIYYQQGLDDKAVEARTRTTLKLANVTRQSAEEVSNQMTAIWNNFDNGTKSLEYYADAITALGAKTASSSSEIAEGLSKFAAVADTIGLSYETATASLATVVAETRQSADTVGNAFKSIFSRLQSLKLGETLEDGVGLTKYSEALEKVGVQVLDINGELRTADDIMSDLGQRWTEISDTQRTALAQTVAGQRQYAQFVALFDNWDKVQSNIGIAEGSEGTLQEQADIYAESWEAASKRVQASAEAIYDALVSDKFFIGFNNLIAGVLDRVNDLIKGLGGLPGVLTTVGALLTKVFSTQLAGQIERIAYNIKMSTAQGRASVQALQQQANLSLQKNAQESALKGTNIGEAQSLAYKNQADLQQTLIKNSEQYNQEQIKTAQYLLDQNKALGDNVIKQGQLADEAQREAERLSRSVLSKARNDTVGVEESTIQRLQQVLNTAQEMSPAFEKLQTNLTNFESTLNDTSLTAEQKVSQIQQAFQANETSIKKFCEQTGVDFEKLKTEVGQLNASNLDQFKQTLQQLSNQGSDHLEQVYLVIEKIIRAIFGDTPEATKMIDDLRAGFGRLGAAGGELEAGLQGARNSAQGTKEALDGMTKSSIDGAQAFASFAGVMMSLASVINSVKAAWDIWNNDELSVPEKLLQTVPSLIMSFSMLTTAMTGARGAQALYAAGQIPLVGSILSATAAKTGDTVATNILKGSMDSATISAYSLGTALKVAFPLIGAITVAIGGIAAAAYAWDKTHYSFAEQMEDAKAATERAAEAADKAKQEYENLSSAWDNYETVKDTLDSCTLGTDEWREALEKVSEVTNNLIKDFPELLDFYDSSKGVFDTKQVDEYLQKMQQAQQITQFQNLYAPTVEKRIESDEAKEAWENVQGYIEDRASEFNEGTAWGGTDIASTYLQNNYGYTPNGSVGMGSEGGNGQVIVSSTEYSQYFNSAIEQLRQDVDLTEENAYGKLKDILGEIPELKEKIIDAINEDIQQFQDSEGVTKAFEDLDESVQNEILDEYLNSLTNGMDAYVSFFVKAKETTEEYKGTLDLAIDRIINSALMQIDDTTVGNFTKVLLNDKLKDRIKSNSEYEGNTQKDFDKSRQGEMDATGQTEGLSIRAQDSYYMKNGNADTEHGNNNNRWQREFTSAYLEAMGPSSGLRYANEAKGNDENRQYAFLNEQNEKVWITVEEMAQAITLFQDGILNFSSLLNEAGEEAQKIFGEDLPEDFDAAFGEGIKKGGSFDFTNVSQSALNQMFTNEDGKVIASGLTDKIVKGLNLEDKSLEEKNAAFEEIFDITYSDLIEALREGLDNYQNDVEALSDDIKSSDTQEAFDQIVGTIENESLSVKDAAKRQLKSAYVNGGNEAVDALANLYTEAGENAVKLTELDFSSFDSLEDFKDGLEDVGLESLASSENLELVYNSLKRIAEESPKSASESISSVNKITSKLSKGDTISEEDYQILNSETNGDLAQYFAIMADGTYKLIEDAENFQKAVDDISLQKVVDEIKNRNQEAEAIAEKFGSADKVKEYANSSAEWHEKEQGQGYKGGDYFSAGGTQKEEVLRDQINFLTEIGKLTEDQIYDLGQDIDENGKLSLDNLHLVHNLMLDVANDWDEINEKVENNEKLTEEDVGKILSLTPNLTQLKEFFEANSDLFEGMNFEDLAKQWTEAYSGDAVVTTLQEFKDATSEFEGIEGTVQLKGEEAQEAWHKIHSSLELTRSDIPFLEQALADGDITAEDFAEDMLKIQENTAKSIETFAQLHNNIDVLNAEQYSQVLSNLLNKNDTGTLSALKEIDKALQEGKYDAEQLGSVVDRIKDAKDLTSSEKVQEIDRENSTWHKEKNANGNEVNVKNVSDRTAGFAKMDVAANADDMFDTDRLALYQEGLDQIGSKATLTAIDIRKIGEAATSIVSGSELISTAEQLSTIRDAFSNADGAIDPENLKIYADSIKDIVLNADDLTLDEKFSTIKQELIDAGVPLEYIDEEIINLIVDSDNLSLEEKLLAIAKSGLDLKENLAEVDKLINDILGNEQSSTVEKLQELHALLDMGADASSIAQGIADAIDSDETTNILEKQQTFNSMANTAPEKPEIIKPSQQNPMMGAIDAGDQLEQSKADWAQYSEDLATYNVQLEAYDRWLSSISGKDFSSLDQLRDFSDTIPDLEQLQDSFNEGDAIAEYASQFDRCTDAVRQYNEALAQGKDTSEALFNMDYLSRVEDAANLYDIDADRVQAMAEAYQDQKDVLNDNGNSLLGLVDVEGDAEESAKRLAEASVDAATRFVRFNDAIEDLKKNGSKLESTLKEIGDNAKKAGKSVKEIAAGTQDYSDAMKSGKKIMSDLLGVETKMMKDDLVTKHFDKAVKAAEKGGDAMEDFTKELRDDYIKSLGEDIDMSNLSDGVKEALNGQDIQSAMSDFMNNLAQLSEGDPIDINNEPFLQALIESQLAAGATADDIESMLSGMGIDADVEPFMGSMADLENSAAAAADSTAQSGDAIVGNMSFDAQANSLTVSNADVKEDVGFDVERTGPVTIPVSIPDFTSGGTLDYGEDGKGKVYKVQVSGTTGGTGVVYGYKAVPHTETETEQKDQTITGVKISNAHKSAGGKTSAGNSGGSGNKGGGKGGGCFVAGTPITTSHGFKNIEDIKVGDMVLSYNQKTKQNEYSEVVNTIIHFVHEEIYTLTIENEKIVTTGIHKFLVIREKQIRWVHAHDLVVGDLVLFADRTLHKISNIDIKIEFKTVYNFTVSNNHNYYVGIKQVLAHNRGSKGGSGGRGKEARMVTKRGVSAEHVDPVQERYHVVTKNLDTLAKKLTDVSSAKDRAFGTKRVDYIEKETKALQAEIAKMQEYKKEIDDYYKKDVETLKSGNPNLTFTQSNLQGIEANKKVAKTKNGKVVKKNGKTQYKTVKDWTLKEDEQIAKVDSSKYNIKSLLGYEPEIDEAGGAIKNIDQIRKDAAKVLNDFYANEWTKHKEDSDLDIEKFKTNGKVDEKKWKAAIEQEEALRNKKAQLEAWYESLEEDFANFYDSLERKQQEATDEINKHIELLQSRLEHTVYAVELKIEIDDSAINIIQSKIDSLGGKARTAAERITELGNIMRKIGGATENTITQDENGNTKYTKANKITANEWGFANVLNNVANNDNTYGIVDNSGETQYFNKEGLTDKSQYLNGDAILQDFKTNGKAATDSINTLVSSNILKQNSELIEQLNTFAQNELEYVQEIRDYRTQIMDIMAATWDEYSEDMDSIIVKQEHLNTLVNGYYNVIDLVGRSRFYQDADKGRQMEAKLDAQLKAQANQSLANVKKERETIQDLIGKETDEKSIAGRRKNASDKVAEYDKKIAQATTEAEKESLRRSKEEWAQQLDSYDNILKSMQDKLREAEENEQAAFENALQTNLDTFERALKRASETFSDAMAKNVGDLDYLQEYLEMQQQISDQTVASYEKAHQLRQMELEAQKSIEKATDPKIKRELLAIQDEITQKAVDGKEATEYELKFLRQKLELKQAEAALEEAQKAKTQVSLTRDNEGNFGYVYTADDSAVADAEKNYSDKIYEMQRDNQEYIQNLSAQLLQAEMDYQQRMEEISLSELDDATKKARLEEVDAQFNTLHQSLTDQMTNALNASQDIFGEYSNNYASITGDLMATNLTHIESFQQTEYAVKTGYESMTEYVNAWSSNHAKYLEQCEGALTDYATATNATFKAMGVTYEEGSTAMETYADDMVTETEKITTALGEGTEGEPGLAAQLGELGSTAEQTFEDMLTSVTGIEEGFVGSLGAMQEAAENLAEAILEVQEQLSALEEQSDTLQAITGSDGNSSTTRETRKEGRRGRERNKKGNKNLGYRKGVRVRKNGKRVRRIVIKDSARKIRLTRAQAKAALNRKEEKRALRTYKRENRIKGRLSARQEAAAYRRAAKRKVRRLLNDYKKVTIRFNTGGYTGDWDGTEGKIAMVHKKELILNQADTQNILGAVGMIREISNKVDLNALASSGALSRLSSPGLGNFNNELEQHVQIEANFPNATSREEIQAAFENLIGLASQYANRS